MEGYHFKLEDFYSYFSVLLLYSSSDIVKYESRCRDEKRKLLARIYCRVEKVDSEIIARSAWDQSIFMYSHTLLYLPSYILHNIDFYSRSGTNKIYHKTRVDKVSYWPDTRMLKSISQCCI